MSTLSDLMGIVALEIFMMTGPELLFRVCRLRLRHAEKLSERNQIGREADKGEARGSKEWQLVTPCPRSPLIPGAPDPLLRVHTVRKLAMAHLHESDASPESACVPSSVVVRRLTATGEALLVLGVHQHVEGHSARSRPAPR